MHRLWIGLGSLAGLGAVAMAAAAAHTLNGLSPGMLHVVESGVQMQGWHALALVLCGVWAQRRGGVAHWAGGAFAVGTALFCGAVYALALGGVGTGPMAPVGATLLMAGWALLGVSALRRG